MSYRTATKDKVVKFLRRKKSCFVSELCYLGKSKMVVKYPIVREIVDDLIAKHEAYIESVRFGKRTFYRVSWGRKK
jgi:hypothetical protein